MSLGANELRVKSDGAQKWIAPGILGIKVI